MAGFDLVQHPGHHRLGVIPHGVRADALLRSSRELHDDLVEAEMAVDRKDQLVDLVTLLGQLRLGAEDMRVVLGEGADAHQPVQRA